MKKVRNKTTLRVRSDTEGELQRTQKVQPRCDHLKQEEMHHIDPYPHVTLSVQKVQENIGIELG